MSPDEITKAIEEHAADYQALLENTEKIKGKKFADIVRCIARLQVSGLVLCDATQDSPLLHAIVHATIDKCIEDMFNMLESESDSVEAAKLVISLIKIAKIA